MSITFELLWLAQVNQVLSLVGSWTLPIISAVVTTLIAKRFKQSLPRLVCIYGAIIFAIMYAMSAINCFVFNSTFFGKQYVFWNIGPDQLIIIHLLTYITFLRLCQIHTLVPFIFVHTYLVLLIPRGVLAICDVLLVDRQLYDMIIIATLLFIYVLTVDLCIRYKLLSVDYTTINSDKFMAANILLYLIPLFLTTHSKIYAPSH